MGNSNTVVSCARHLQNVGGKLGAALERRGRTVPDFLAWLARGENKPVIEEIADFAKRIPAKRSVIPFSVTSDGRSAETIIAAIEAAGKTVPDWIRQTVIKNPYTLTTGVVYNFVGVSGGEFPNGKARTTRAIRAEAVRRTYLEPNLESALLTLEKHSLEDFGAHYVAVMHPGVLSARGSPRVLGLRRDHTGEYVNAWSAGPARRWLRGGLFLFLAPQVPVVGES